MSIVVDVNRVSDSIDQDEDTYEKLKKAAQDGDIERLYELIAGDPDILEQIDKLSFRETPLHVAAEKGQTHFAMEVMNLKPSLALKLNASGYSPMHLALQGNHVRMVRGFVAVDSSLVSIKGRGRITPLHHVARIGDGELLNLFSSRCLHHSTFDPVDMEEKVRSLHEDVTKHWIARELALLQRRINQANEKGWRRELSQYLEKRELLTNPEEQSRLLCEVPEVVAEELEPQCVDDGVKIEDDFMEPNPVAYIEAHQSDDEEQQPSDSPVHSIQKNLENDFMESNSVTFVEAHQSEEEQQLSDSPVDTVQKNLENSKLRDGEDQPSRAASADDKDRRGDAEEQPESGIITENKESTTENVPQIEIIELSDDDDEDNDNDNGAYEQYDPKKVMWCYEQPKGRTNGPFSLAQLKEWNDEEYFVQVPDFKVWMTGKGMRSAMLLTKLVHDIKA